MTDETRKDGQGAGERGEGAKRQARAATKEVRAALDRVEDGSIAVLILEDDAETQLDLPLSRLPDGATDGDHFRLTFETDDEGRPGKLLRAERDAAARAAAEERIRALQQRLAARSNTEGKKDFKL